MPQSTSEKVHENKLRRMAERQGLALVKSRRRDPRAIDYGALTLVDRRSNALVGTDLSYGGMSLEQIEGYLTGEPT